MFNSLCCCGSYPAACGASRHRASPACSMGIARDDIGSILVVRWDMYRARPFGGPLEVVLRPLGGCLGACWKLRGVLLNFWRPLGISWKPLLEASPSTATDL
eukprot:8846309-Pyramimonas_sp.AAC.1